MAHANLLTALVLAAVGAVALFLLLRPAEDAGARVVRRVAALVGLAVVALVFREIAVALGDAGGSRPDAFFYVFSFIAIACAVRMITHERPVYCALYFVLVVISSAALFLLLGAEFMAFALVIVYAGAILITYLFVLMLAQQVPEPGQVEGRAEYDRVPREPATAVLVGFVMLALLTDLVLHGPPDLPAPDPRAADRRAWTELERLPKRFEAVVLEAEPRFDWPPLAADDGALVRLAGDGTAFVTGTLDGDPGVVRVELPDTAQPQNVQRVGWALVHEFPASLEVAGVILLLAMFGAVVLARRQIELGEEEIRAAAGLAPAGDPDGLAGPGGAA